VAILSISAVVVKRDICFIIVAVIPSAFVCLAMISQYLGMVFCMTKFNQKIGKISSISEPNPVGNVIDIAFCQRVPTSLSPVDAKAKLMQQ
jgi:hypothetical protein